MPFTQHRFSLYFNKGKLFYLEYNLRLFIYLFFKRFDVVCSVDLDTLLPGFLVGSLKRKICVYDAHEYFTEVPEVIERPLVKKTWEILAHLLIPRLKYACTVNESLAQLFQKRYGTPFEVFRNLPFQKQLPIETSRDKFLKKPFVLLYQGVLNDGRGLEEVMDALPFLEDTVLWLAGEGDCSEALRLKAQQMGLEARIRFFGKVPPDELAQLTPSACIGLNLLKNKGLNYYYSLANKAFDYIQAGIPSLNMSFPEYQHINQAHEVFYLLDRLEIPSIVAAVRQLQTDTGLYEKLVKN
jgi:glycosyltransferase involved in cell wall biosynthesis